ncbi:MAG TPA: Gfo/Idh/MocA family oxidoreductase [bacterium]|nr:Gfo/Idh/MocA family oxidoreductase [bacterium]
MNQHNVMTTDQATAPWRVALIGCGRIGTLLEDDPLRAKPCTHAGAFSSHPAFRLVAGCDINRERILKFGQRWGLQPAQCYEDYHELLERERPDIVAVATWTGTHGDIVDAACDAGVRAIFCEKPLEATVQRSREMVRRCLDRNVLFVVDHDRRWCWPYRNARALIRSGRLGAVRTVNGCVLTGPPLSDWHSDPIRAGAGPLLHDGTHLVDAVRFLIDDDYAEVRGAVEREPGWQVEHTARAWFTTRNGVHGFLEAGGRRGYFHFEIDVQLQHGRIAIGNGFSRAYAARDSRLYSGFRDLVEIPFPDEDRRPRYTIALDEVNAALHGHGTVSSTGYDALRVMELIDGVYRSAANGGATVTLAK